MKVIKKAFGLGKWQFIQTVHERFYSKVLTLFPSCWMSILASFTSSFHHAMVGDLLRLVPIPGLLLLLLQQGTALKSSRVLKLQRSSGNRAGPDSVFTFTAKSMLKDVEIGLETLWLQTIKNSIPPPQEHLPRVLSKLKPQPCSVHGWTTDLF